MAGISVQPPDPPAPGGLRIGDVVGPLDALDPDLADRVRDDWSPAAATAPVSPRPRSPFARPSAVRTGACGAPVLALWIGATGYAGGRVVPTTAASRGGPTCGRWEGSTGDLVRGSVAVHAQPGR